MGEDLRRRRDAIRRLASGVKVGRRETLGQKDIRTHNARPSPTCITEEVNAMVSTSRTARSSVILLLKNKANNEVVGGVLSLGLISR